MLTFGERNGVRLDKITRYTIARYESTLNCKLIGES